MKKTIEIPTKLYERIEKKAEEKNITTDQFLDQLLTLLIELCDITDGKV